MAKERDCYSENQTVPSINKDASYRSSCLFGGEADGAGKQLLHLRAEMDQ
jgi:hypothetical protein